MLCIRHTGIYVKDLTRMKEFYCNTFGMEIAHEGIEDGEYIEKLLGKKKLSIEVCKLKNSDGTMIELIKSNRDNIKEAHSESVINVGCMHIAFTVNNLEQLYKKLKYNGESFISEPLLSPDGKVHVCFCKDPEGNYLELVQDLG